MMIREIKYSPPLLKNFGEDYKGGILLLTKLDEWRAKYTGKFVLSAIEDAIKLWALADAYKHSQVVSECNVEGMILGGGSIGVDKEIKPRAVYSSSMEFGSLLNKVLIDYFSYFGYNVKVEMFEEGETRGIELRTRRWFKDHGIDV